MLTDYLPTIANFKLNAASSAFGAILVIFYQLFKAMPDINADLFVVRQAPKHHFLAPIGVIAIKGLISILGAALVTAFLIRPSESYGAFLSGMTWTAVVESFLRKKGDTP
jgi:hypothetical protein